MAARPPPTSCTPTPASRRASTWTTSDPAGGGRRLRRALLLFGEQTLAAAEASSWDESWPTQRGTEAPAQPPGLAAATFTDFATLVPQAAPILGEPPSWVTDLVGTINGPRAVTVERTYIRAWFQEHVPGPPRHSPAYGTLAALPRGPVRALAPCGGPGSNRGQVKLALARQDLPTDGQDKVTEPLQPQPPRQVGGEEPGRVDLAPGSCGTPRPAGTSPRTRGGPRGCPSPGRPARHVP